MSYSFKNGSGKKSFGVFSEPLNAGDYINNKKAKTLLCAANNLLLFKKSTPLFYAANGCSTGMPVGSENDLLLLQKANALKQHLNEIKNANLYINLFSELNLQNISVIEDLSGNVPATIAPLAIPYLEYIVDPSGSLFGNSICGENNYVQYMVYNLPTYL